MDLLTGYGSDVSEDENDYVPPSTSAGPAAAGLQGALQEPEAQRRQGPSASTEAAVTEDDVTRGGASSGLWAQLPRPTSVASSVPSTSGLSGLPPPKGADARGGARKVVTMQLPFRKELLAAALNSDDEDEPAAKRVKTTGAKSRLMDFLPPPKHDRRPVRALGGGGSSGAGAGLIPEKATAASSAAAATGGGKGGSGALSGNLPANFFTGEPDTYDNEAYRIPEGQGDGGVPRTVPGAYHDPSAGTFPYGAPEGAYNPAAYYGHDYGPGAGTVGAAMAVSSGRGGAGESAAAPEDMIAEALRAEQERASKRGGGTAGVKLVEISAKDLTRMDPAAREAANSARDALGAEYAQSLRRSAAPYEGTKMARRKHQIGTLLFNARMQELDQLEKRTQGQKSKAETAAKYGW